MSQLEDVASGRVRSTALTGWTVLRHGWPCLLLLAGFIWAQVVQPLGSPEAGAVFALSPAALAEGRWWTVLTHMFSSGLSGFFLSIATFLAGCTAVTARDPDWMGGWRTPAVFVACGLVGALVHLMSAGGAPLLSSWPAVVGLLAFWLASRRWPSWESRSSRRPEKAEPETWLERGWNGGWWGLIPLLYLLSSPHQVQHPLPLTFATGLAVALIGGAVILGLTALGGIARRIAGLAQIVFAVTVMGMTLAKSLAETDFDIPLVVAMLGSLVFGGLLGARPRPVDTD